ncbi:MAG: nuclease-related domain-containing protein [Pseudomonadota bacterium]
MADWLGVPGGVYALPLVLVVLLLLWLAYRHRRRHDRSVDEVIKSISYEYLSNLVIPKADDGEIHLNHLLLTAEGLLIVEVKDVQGIVFGSDKMQDWTVIAKDRRYTFNNPQPGMFDRIAAVRQIVRQVPVTGRILFLDGAEFTKGVPGLVTTLDDLLAEFGETDKLTATAKIEAFKPHWDAISQAARSPDG